MYLLVIHFNDKLFLMKFFIIFIFQLDNKCNKEITNLWDFENPKGTLSKKGTLTSHIWKSSQQLLSLFLHLSNLINILRHEI